ncbi:MAG: hypothetical protein WBD41_17725 [Rhodococcus sp. (in: high G+C Gram-positive bacteria)]
MTSRRRTTEPGTRDTVTDGPTHTPRALGLVPARVPDLGAHQIIASQLATGGMDGNPIYRSAHLGRIIAVRRGGAIIAGPLRSVTDSVVLGRLVLGIGDTETVAVGYTHPISVAPARSRLSIIVTPHTENTR